MGYCHTLMDGRAVATPIPQWGIALGCWGGKRALIDGQECPSYLMRTVVSSWGIHS